MEPHKRPLSADKETEVRCSSTGSRPPANITWWKGSKEIKSGISSSQSPDASTSMLRFTPTVEDNGKYFSCRAHNPLIPGSSKEEGWNLEVFCKFSCKLKYIILNKHSNNITLIIIFM